MILSDRKRNRSRWISAPVMGLVLLCGLCGNHPAWAQWPQWGGPTRDFQAPSTKLASQWPQDGPSRVWTRKLGEGHSAIVVDGNRIFTMYHQGDTEVVVALEADTGKTVWETKDRAPMIDGIEQRFGRGPNSTPLVCGSSLYTLGVTGRLHCIDKTTGKVLWSHDLVKEVAAKPPEFGFSSSPLAYKNSLIVAVGGAGCGMMAFDLTSGKILWKRHDFQNIYSSPILLNVGGEDQVAILVDREIVGVDPKTGDLKWRHPHENQWKTNISTPVWGRDQMLYVTSSGDAGSRVLKLTREGEKTHVQEVWANRKMRVGQGNVVRVGDYLYGCSGGGDSPALMTAIHVATGRIAWRQRLPAKTMLVYGDGKLILLDEEGNLSLATATPKAFTIRSTVALLKRVAWTVPTLVGRRLYVRDNGTIMALDLG